MKKFAIWGALAVALVNVNASDAGAGITMSGVYCMPVGPNALSPGPDWEVFMRDPAGIYNPLGEDVRFMCPLPVDHQLGATVTFRIRMFDINSDSGENITCTGSAYNQDGGLIASTAAINSGSSSTYTGTANRTGTLAVASQASTHFYSLVCTIPQTYGPGTSGIQTVRVY